MNQQKVIELETKLAALEAEAITLQKECDVLNKSINWTGKAIIISVVGLIVLVGFITLPIAIYYLIRLQKKERILLERLFYCEEEIFYYREELVEAKGS